MKLSNISKPISNKISRSISHKIYEAPFMASGGSGPSPFDPDLSNIQSRILDGGTIWTDSVSSKYYLKDQSTDNTHLPRQGRCWLFDGVNDRAVTGSDITLTGEFTAAIWVKPSTNGTQAIFGRNFAAGQMTYNNASGNITLETNTASSTPFSTGLTTATWCHICITRNSSNLVTVYKNGVSIGSQTVTGTLEIGQIGARNSATPTSFWNGSFRDIRIYSSAKDSTAVAAIYNQSLTGNGAFDLTNLVACYPCNEESGTTGYDISGNGNNLTLTNITQATFHAADTGVLTNRNNDEGYRLSSGVYIPKRLSDANAADGNALTVTGRAAYHGCAETPCFTGNGSNTSITISSVLASITGDFEFTGWFKTEKTYGALWGNHTNGLYLDTLISLRLYVAGTHTQFIGITLVIGQWHFWKVTRISGTVSMWIDGVALTRNAGPDPNNGTITVSTIGNGFSGFSILGSVSDFRFTIDGVTTCFPLQDGPGSSNTNRNLAYVKSDGTGGVISNAIVNGTVSTIWANRVPGQVKDWCIDNGGRIGAAGEFIAGLIGSANAADGNAKTLTAGKHGNPFSRLNLNPATAAEFNGRSIPTASAVANDINAAVTPAESAFRRTDTDGDDRFLIYESALTGSDLTNVETYVS